MTEVDLIEMVCDWTGELPMVVPLPHTELSADDRAPQSIIR